MPEHAILPVRDAKRIWISYKIWKWFWPLWAIPTVACTISIQLHTFWYLTLNYWRIHCKYYLARPYRLFDSLFKFVFWKALVASNLKRRIIHMLFRKILVFFFINNNSLFSLKICNNFILIEINTLLLSIMMQRKLIIIFPPNLKS